MINVILNQHLIFILTAPVLLTAAASKMNNLFAHQLLYKKYAAKIFAAFLIVNIAMSVLQFSVSFRWQRDCLSTV